MTKSNAPGLRKLQPLPRGFYSAAPDVVARQLLGKIILRESNGQILAGRIVETEAYFGVNDPAAHSAAGRTERNAVLFGPPGHAYVYLIYGVYYCLNVSCEPHGQAGCVLIRALDPIAGRDAMIYNRGLSPHASGRALTGGPGKLCSALAITRADNGADMTSRKADLLIVDDNCEEAEIAISPRIGITKAADRPLRFHIRGNPCVSR